MTLVSGLVISPVSRRNLVRGPVIAAALACLIGSAGVLRPGPSPGSAGSSWSPSSSASPWASAAAGNQTALYSQAPAELLGTASGLLAHLRLHRLDRRVGHHRHRLPHPASPTHGVHLIAWIMVGVSVVLVSDLRPDRTLRTKFADN